MRNSKHLLLVPLHLSDLLMLLSPSCLSLDSEQISLELILSFPSDRIPPGYAGSAFSGQLCLYHYSVLPCQESSAMQPVFLQPTCLPVGPTLLASSSPSTLRRAGQAFSSFWREEKNREGDKKRRADGICSVISLCRLGFILPSILQIAMDTMH